MWSKMHRVWEAGREGDQRRTTNGGMEMLVYKGFRNMCKQPSVSPLYIKIQKCFKYNQKCVLNITPGFTADFQQNQGEVQSPKCTQALTFQSASVVQY